MSGGFIKITSHLSMSETENHVFFLGGPFSQWAKTTINGSLPRRNLPLRFNCAEQYMMAAKADFFGDMDCFWGIMEADHPREQKAIGRQVQAFDPAKWETVAYDVVVQANRLKFKQNKAIGMALLGTQTKTLVEGADYDRIWGVGVAWDDERIIDPANWRGQNLLGKALMQVRAEMARTT